jgi:hypothetical protein
MSSLPTARNIALMIRDYRRRLLRSQSLLGMVKAHILPGSTIYTDEYMPYRGIGELNLGYQHKRIHHAAKVYVVGDIHTNSVEGFWSLIKRGIVVFTMRSGSIIYRATLTSTAIGTTGGIRAT